MNLKPKRALISVSDKTNIVEFSKFLHDLGVEIISTGGTAKILRENGIPYTPIENVTGNPEAFGGRMKTISFEIGSALLFRRELQEDLDQAKTLGIEAIDLVVCNLYPFEKTAREKKPFPELIENIDIGGPTMIRAAAKNFESVTCVTSPDDYSKIMAELTLEAAITLETRKKLALKAFTTIASYDLSIAIELSQQMGSGLRYGENPHQRAALLQVNNSSNETPLARAKFLQGKELSYNNLLDSDQAYKCCSEVKSANADQAVCVIVKHGTPCGVATHPFQLEALKLAWDADSISAFGSILCFSEEVTTEVAHFLKERFIEVVIAPSFSNEALQILGTKKNVRVLQTQLKPANASEWTVRSISGGLLCQDEDQGISTELKSVAKKGFPSKLLPVAQFGLVVTKYLKSNCIGVFAEKGGGMVILSSGVGQPNRLDCITRLIKTRLSEKREDMSGAVLVSDAFFPFRDSIEAAHDLGVAAIVQPGGSIKDLEVIAACDEFGMSMLMTGMRHFRH
jgi:phosphoribosylaminoimidazolecarboxamide formyltransferase/IMP cyclohydrolase